MGTVEKKTVPDWLAEVDYSFDGYIPKKESLEYINIVKLVNMDRGGEENSTPPFH